jgi:hypothetical protein
MLDSPLEFVTLFTGMAGRVPNAAATSERAIKTEAGSTHKQDWPDFFFMQILEVV